MEKVSSQSTSSFSTQANALFRKNLCFQRRNIKTNLCLTLFPVILCVVLVIIQNIVNTDLNKLDKKCGCRCIDTHKSGTCKNVCGIQYSKTDQLLACAMSNPPAWPPLLQVPRPENRAARVNPASSLPGLPELSCRKTKTCPATILFTGKNQIFATSLTQMLFEYSDMNWSSSLNLSVFTLGTDTYPTYTEFVEPAFFSKKPVYSLQSRCTTDYLVTPIPILELDHFSVKQNGVKCVESLNLWCDNSSTVNDALFKGYRQGNNDESINEYISAYDFLNSGMRNLNVSIWYNSTYKNATIWGPPPALSRVLLSVNAVSNAYLQLLKGSHVKMQLAFTKEMPTHGSTQIKLDLSLLLGPVFYKWVIELIFPVLLTHLVYEKEQKLITMMKMHGLMDGVYWLVTYGYFLFISMFYILFFVLFGSIIGLQLFTLNDYKIQFLFFFAYINLQIALAFISATIFDNMKTAEVFAYMYILGTGILAGHLLRYLIEGPTFPRKWEILIEFIPAFSLGRGLYEFEQYSLRAKYMGIGGISWKDLQDSNNGFRDALTIIIIESCMLLPIAYYLDQLFAICRKNRKDSVFFIKCFQSKLSLSQEKKKFQIKRSKVYVEIDKPDVIQERKTVEKIILDSNANYAIVSDNLSMVYPGQDGNPNKLAVQGLYLALQRGECFGFLGPNGAGKTSFINMMTGLITPSSGNAYVEGYNIQTDMKKIYTNMGVCPQDDMLWELLTGREHLQFYGRLKNLQGHTLLQAVEESLDSVNLLHGGFGDKQVWAYSGGMKRRLSVAISLIGDSKVVYMDEPTTGLDPASRNNLWNVMKKAKKDRAIILTTHSMEEAEFLCDRLGIFVNGSMQCIGNPKHLKARYGDIYVLTVATHQKEEENVENIVRQLSPGAKKIYHIPGTQKFEISKDMKISTIFKAIEEAKKRFDVYDWGISGTTLEDVFIKVAREAVF